MTMHEEAFRFWLSNSRRTASGAPLNARTIDSRLANCRTVEWCEGDLDEHFDHDQLLGLLDRLKYSKNDERRNRSASHRIPINGNVYNGTATYRSAVSLYRQFRETGIEGTTSLSQTPTRTRKPMIMGRDQYYLWLQEQGVGIKDKVASSPDSYISYLNSVSRLLGKDISPAILSTEEDVISIARSIEGRRGAATIRNYQSAMRQYVAMVHAYAVPADSSPGATVDSANDRGFAQLSNSPEVSTATEHNTYSPHHMTPFEIRGADLRSAAKTLVLEFMASRPECQQSGYGMRQAQIFRQCGFDWGYYLKAEHSRQQFWIVALLRTLEAEGKIQQLGERGQWRLA